MPSAPNDDKALPFSVPDAASDSEAHHAHVERRLHDTEALLYRTLDAVTDAVVITDNELRPIYLNGAFAKLLGRGRDELMGRPLKLEDIISSDDLPKLREQVGARLSGAVQQGPAVYGVSRADGHVRSVEVCSAPLLRDHGVAGVVGVIRDITDSQRQALHLQRAQRIAGVGSWEFDLVSGVLLWSQETFRLLGYDPCVDTPSLESFLARLHEEDRPRMEAEIERAMRGEPETAMDYRLVLPNGEVRHVQSNATVSYAADGHATHMMGVIHDVTDRVQLQQRLTEEQKLEAVGRLSAGIAHEFNNLLGVVRSWLTSASPVSLARPAELEQVVNRCDRAATLVRQLQQFSGTTFPRMAPAGVNQVLARAVRFVSELLDERVSLVASPLVGDARLLADADLIERVLVDLLLNARDAVMDRLVDEPAHRPTIEVAVDLGGSGTTPLRIIVEDNGCGMDSKTRARVFEPFFTTKATRRATGLGLSIAYGVVQEHHGHIRVWSDPGRGSRFTVCLPVCTELQQSPPASKEPWVRGGCILVVDDEPVLRALAERVLFGASYQVRQADGGNSAILAIDAGGIDVVVLDLNMPDVDGYQVLAHIRTHHPDLPVIVASGYADESRVGELGAAAVLPKPYSPDELLSAVDAALQDR